MKLLISSASMEELITQIGKYYYSPNIRVENGKVFNSKGEINGVRVIEKKKRFRFERL